MSRKSLAFLSLLSFLILSACTADDYAEHGFASSDGREAIEFRVDYIASARAARESTIAVTDFKTTVIDNGSAFTSSPISVSSYDNGNHWTTSDRIYWPTDRSADWRGLTFVAFTDGNPSGSSIRLQGGKASLTDYEVPTDVSAQTDLLYAVAPNVRPESFGGHVDMKFRQALATVGFSVYAGGSMEEGFEVISIELGGVSGKGSYTFPGASTETASGKWTTDTSAAPCSYVIGHTGKSRAEEDDVIRVIPQKTYEGAYIKVTARITSQDNTDEGGICEQIIPISTEWQEGAYYHYNIDWNSASIGLNINVADFDEVSMTADL